MKYISPNEFELVSKKVSKKILIPLCRDYLEKMVFRDNNCVDSFWVNGQRQGLIGILELKAEKILKARTLGQLREENFELYKRCLSCFYYTEKDVAPDFSNILF